MSISDVQVIKNMHWRNKISDTHMEYFMDDYGGSSATAIKLHKNMHFFYLTVCVCFTLLIRKEEKHILFWNYVVFVLQWQANHN